MEARGFEPARHVRVLHKDATFKFWRGRKIQVPVTMQGKSAGAHNADDMMMTLPSQHQAPEPAPSTENGPASPETGRRAAGCEKNARFGEDPDGTEPGVVRLEPHCVAARWGTTTLDITLISRRYRVDTLLLLILLLLQLLLLLLPLLLLLLLLLPLL